MKKFLALTLAVVMCLSMLAACGSGAAADDKKAEASGDKITLSIMHFASAQTAEHDEKAAGFQAMLAKFQEENPDVIIENNEMSHDDYQPKIQSMAAVGEMPDIFFVKGPWIDTFNESGLIADLSADVAAYEHADQYRDGVFDVAKRGDAIYGVPYQGLDRTCLVWYNKDLWKQAGYEEFPGTWEEVLAAGEKFKEMNIPLLGLGNKDKWPINSCIFSTLGSRFTGEEWTQSIIANDGKAKFTDPEFVNALQFVQDLVSNGYVNPDFNSVDNNQTQAMFLEGKYAMTIEGAWMLGRVLGEATEEQRENVGIAFMPQPANAKGDAMTSSGCAGWLMGMSSSLEGEKREAAVKLLFTLGGIEYSEYIAENFNNVVTPCVTQVTREDLPQIQKDFNQYNNDAHLIPVYDVYMNPTVIDVMNTCFQELMNGTKTAEECAAEIQAAQDAT